MHRCILTLTLVTFVKPFSTVRLHMAAKTGCLCKYTAIGCICLTFLHHVLRLTALDDLVTPHFSGTIALLSNYQTEQFWLQLTGCSIWKITLPFLSVHYWNGRKLWFLLVIMVIMLLTMTILRYCNSRVSVYDGAGRHLHDLEGDWTVVHSLALYEQVRKYMWGCQLHYFLILMTWSN